jgi:hypothetical protein
MEFVKELLRILEALGKHDVEYILIGGAALNVHGLVRATRDIDLFIAPSTENVERLKEALRSLYTDEHIEQISAEDLCGDYPAVRYGPPTGPVFFDILTRLGERFRYEDLEYEKIELEGVAVRVATPRTLYMMKKDTVRPMDKADALALKQAFDIEKEDLDVR